jgi:hypothetical protein
MHRAIDSVVQQKTLGEESLFTVWKRLQKAVNSGMPPGTATFLTLLEPYNAPELFFVKCCSQTYTNRDF